MRPLGGQALRNLFSEVRVLRPRAAAYILVMRSMMMMVPLRSRNARIARCGVLCEPQSDVPQRGGHSRDVVSPSSHHSLAKVASEAGQARQLWRANAAGIRRDRIRTGDQTLWTTTTGRRLDRARRGVLCWLWSIWCLIKRRRE